MDDGDIVTRLRGHISITTRIHYAKDGYPEPVYVHGVSPICQEAADEIERLRAERDEIQRELRKAETESSILRVECGMIAAERDEARREVCVLMQRTGFLRGDYASERGWDCFKEANDER